MTVTSKQITIGLVITSILCLLLVCILAADSYSKSNTQDNVISMMTLIALFVSFILVMTSFFMIRRYYENQISNMTLAPQTLQGKVLSVVGDQNLQNKVTSEVKSGLNKLGGIFSRKSVTATTTPTSTSSSTTTTTN